MSLIITENDDLEWNHIYERNIQLFLTKHSEFFEKNSLNAKEHLGDCYKEFLVPFIDKLNSN